ncbi:MAG: MltA domain-containing protein [Rhodobacteraceae bacterium]|nr:MltA domain-containing protein [Paracoccaceae bacterium]
MSTSAEAFSDRALPGWSADDHQAALACYLISADLLPGHWPRPGKESARSFFERAFLPRPAVAPALLTGYYEPELEGSPYTTARFCHALYAPPVGWQAAQPWASRTEIEEGNLLAGQELVWLDSPLEAFLAQVQGSVRVRLADGRVWRFGFAGKHGHPYSSIGKELIRRGVLLENDASVAAIRDWAAQHPDQLTSLLRTNASFVFFRPLDLPPESGPLGTLQRPVTPLRSIAVDPDHIPLGAPVWVDWQGQTRLMIAQDTGSAIKGPARGDIFFGSGAAAGALAGALKAEGRMTPLLPKADVP